ncbi:hypothetical protein EDEG_00195 [Edhazardia aedis USNM 41457]|uniref:DNA topoisomerase n=1 Tax=Edhazardia aedis (strain USNM 41457) TaxID=1003232 RepID=J8ZV13_EDHAE|nr:hypothetical protein EDEG_00195 [Edhazardia aedis USNM 41457]|eukprot:EJW03513.1 hypothetical protein EDEG_00195 [Edhazardia aedis USNM 41457]
MIILNVAEKPSVAKTISSLLSNNVHITKSDCKFTPNLKFVFKNNDMIFTSVLGHLFNNDFGSEYNDWANVNPKSLLSADIQRKVVKENINICKNLKKLAQKADLLIIWTDCDREGENIGCEIRDIVYQVRKLNTKRAVFSGITLREIKNSFENLKNLNELASEAVNARIELDLRIGSAFTRLQTLSFNRGSVISYGPCQIPTLGFVVDRMLEKENFIGENFFTLNLIITKENVPIKCIAKKKSRFSDKLVNTENLIPGISCASDTLHKNEDFLHTQLYVNKELNNPKNKKTHSGHQHDIFKWKRGNLFDKNFVLFMFKAISDASVCYVKSVEKKRVEKIRPLPLRTVELQKACASIFKISSHEVMNVAEKLYNNGYISYPRTETDSFSPGFKFVDIINELSKDNHFTNYCKKLENGMMCNPRKGKNNDMAHAPIYPLKSGSNLSGVERKIYEYVSRRFLGCISKNATGFETKVEIIIRFKNRGDFFFCNSNSIIHPQIFNTQETENQISKFAKTSNDDIKELSNYKNNSMNENLTNADFNKNLDLFENENIKNDILYDKITNCDYLLAQKNDNSDAKTYHEKYFQERSENNSCKRRKEFSSPFDITENGAQYHYLGEKNHQNNKENTIESLLNEEIFHLTGFEVVEKNYLEVFTYDKWDEKHIFEYTPNDTLTLLRNGYITIDLKYNSLFKESTNSSIHISKSSGVGTSMLYSKLTIDEGKTKPPDYLTEPDLINLMDKNGIGTDATIAEHIHKIQDRNYCKKKGKFFIATNLGKGLILGFRQIGLIKMTNPKLRSSLEKSLCAISVGECIKGDVLARELAIYENIYDVLNSKIDQVHLNIKKLEDNDNNSSDDMEPQGKSHNSSNTNIFKNEKNKNVIQIPRNKKILGDGVVENLENIISTQISKLHKNNDFKGSYLSHINLRDDNFECKNNNSQHNTIYQNAFFNTGLHSINNMNDLYEDNTIIPICDCKKNTRLNVTNKKGENYGKKFYSCSNWPNGCDFFKWADPIQPKNHKSNGAHDIDSKNRNNNRNRYIKDRNKINEKCYCGYETIEKVATTEKNKGRSFLSCCKAYKACKFFKWLDEL